MALTAPLSKTAIAALLLCGLGLSACAVQPGASRYGGECVDPCGMSYATGHYGGAQYAALTYYQMPDYLNSLSSDPALRVPGTELSGSHMSSYSGQAFGSALECPAGTTLQANGTCLQSGSFTADQVTHSTYSAPSSTQVSGDMLSCPAGTSLQTDGTCLQGSITIFDQSHTGGYKPTPPKQTQYYRPARK